MAITREQQAAIFAKGNNNFISKGGLETTRKQYNEITKQILESEEKERFFQGRIKTERDHRSRLMEIRSRV